MQELDAKVMEVHLFVEVIVAVPSRQIQPDPKKVCPEKILVLIFVGRKSLKLQFVLFVFNCFDVLELLPSPCSEQKKPKVSGEVPNDTVKCAMIE